MAFTVKIILQFLPEDLAPFYICLRGEVRPAYFQICFGRIYTPTIYEKNVKNID